MTAARPEHATLVRRRDVLTRETIDGVVVLPAAGAHPLVLAGSAVSVWAALDRPGTLPEIINRVACAYGLSSQAVAADVERVVGELCAQGSVSCR